MTGFRWTDREVRAALGIEAPRADDGPDADRTYRGITTDSRTTRPGELFVALVGERHDGHEHVPDAFARGAAGAVAARDVAAPGDAVVYRVPDTLVALGRLGRHRRDALAARVVGITGSVGKTTTKELARGALAPAFRVHASRKNFNNRVGVPLTLLETPEETELLIVEMGTNEPGEIGILTEIARPGAGIVTGVSEAHLEGLGTVEDVLVEKAALLEGLPEGGLAIVADDPPELAERARRGDRRVRVAGLTDAADPDLRATELASDGEGRFRFRWRRRTVALRLRGRHAVEDALLALALADEAGVPEEDAARGVGTVEPLRMRGELLRVGELRIVSDCYNASPASVRAAVELLLTVESGGSRVAIVGTMLELGERSDELHRRVLADVLRHPVDLVAATGAFADAAEAMDEDVGRRVIAHPDPEEAYTLLRGRLRGDEAILLKGSRGVALERLIPALERDFGPAPDPGGPGSGGEG